MPARTNLPRCRVNRGTVSLVTYRNSAPISKLGGQAGKPSNYGKLQPQSIELSGIRGIASRHGYRVEKIGLSLYNLKLDPGETQNVAAQHPEIVERLQNIASAARADLGDSLTGAAGKNVRPHGDVGEK